MPVNIAITKQIRAAWTASPAGRAFAAQAAWLGRCAAGLKAWCRPRRAALAISGGELKTAADGLTQVSAALEKNFLLTGDALEKLAGQGGEFVRQSEIFVGSATGRAGGSALFFNAMHVVESPLGFLNNSHPETRRILQRLKQDSERIDELINVQIELQRTIGPLKYIQTLFKIESAPLGGDVQAMFGALTKEIEILHDQVCELFTTKFLELRGIQRTVNQVVHELQTQTDGLWDSIAKEKAQIDHSLHELQQELIDNQARESHISQLSKAINQEIQQVVIGLQYQDIINQKLEHTGASLAQIEAHLNSEHAGAFLKQSCRLEAEQLQAVRKDLAGAEKAIKSGIEKTLDHLVNADTRCLTLAEYKQLTTSADGMVQVLFDVFVTLRKQITTTVASSAGAFEKLRPIGGLASDLTLVVRNLSQRIHLIGLNAQLQAAQVGNGAGLEVLSARTSEISRATNRISEDVAKKLDQLVLDLAEDVKALESLHSAALQQQTILANEGAAAEHELHALRDGALGSLTLINTLLDDIRSESQAIIETVNYVATADGTLADLEKKLRTIADTVGDTGDPATSKAHEFLQKFHNGYTMHSERKVFADVVSGPASPIVLHEEPPVELFAAMPADSTVGMDAVAGPPPAAVATESALPLEPAKPAGSSANLGDNVELF